MSLIFFFSRFDKFFFYLLVSFLFCQITRSFREVFFLNHSIYYKMNDWLMFYKKITRNKTQNNLLLLLKVFWLTIDGCLLSLKVSIYLLIHLHPTHSIIVSISTVAIFDINFIEGVRFNFFPVFFFVINSFSSILSNFSIWL